MNGFPGAPRLLKGGIVVLNATSGAVQTTIALQYNPDTLTRSFQIKGHPTEGDRSEALRLKGPPAETIKVETEMDAAEGLEAGDPGAVEGGLHAALSQLELLIYPTSALLLANDAEAASGSLEIVSMESPLTVFVFGPKRIAPVRITEMSVTEEAFDPELNPIRARVSLTMRVLTVDDIPLGQKGGALFLAYLQSKERLAQGAKPGSFGALGISGLP